MRHPNRANAMKNKKKRACAMCKHYKRGWSHNFKEKERVWKSEGNPNIELN